MKKNLPRASRLAKVASLSAERRRDEKSFIAWAFERHCEKHHNDDFEVCPDAACQAAVEFEKAIQKYVEQMVNVKDEKILI